MTPSLTVRPRAEAIPGDGLRILPEWILLLFVFTMPWEDQFTIETFGTVSRAFGAAAFGAGVLSVIATSRMRPPHPIHLALTLFLLWASSTYFWSLVPDETWYILPTYLQLAAMVWMLHEFAPTPAAQLRVMKAYVLGSLVSLAATIDGFASGTTGRLSGATKRLWQRYAAEGFEPNDLCIIFAISFVLSVHVALRERKGPMRWVWRLQPAIALFAGALTASRAGAVALAIGIAYVLASLRGIRPSRALLVGAVILATLVAVAFWAPETSVERVSTMFTELASGTLSDRSSIWRATWQLFSDRPFTGIGLGATAESVRPFLGFAVVGHQVFLTAMTETGIFGMLIFLAALALMLHAVRRMPVFDRRLWVFLALVWMCAALTLSWLHRKPTWFLFGLLASQAGTFSRLRKTHGPAGVQASEEEFADD